MERLVRTLRVNGYRVDVIEVMDDDDVFYLVAVDNTLIDANARMATAPDDEEICAVVRAWSEGR